MVRDKQERKNSKTVASTAGKVTLSDLVSAGLLQPGAVVVCNSWPFTAIVSETGRLDAKWTPIPSDFIQPVAGSEFMRPEFETPSAWATAVCRVMRAQQQQPSHSRNSNGECRVAVNGWTACRVKVEGEGEEVEISLDTLRRQYNSDGAVDGLAQQVALGLALGSNANGVSQRRAAAAASTAMASAGWDQQQQRIAGGAYNRRKRKSIPDMSRHAKLSRVPTAESSDNEGGGGADDETVRLALDRFQAAADACSREERKALRVRRRQALRQAIAAATSQWLDSRRRRRRRPQLGQAPHVAASSFLSSMLVPRSVVALPCLCVACGSAGANLHACEVCGDCYHGFCAEVVSGRPFVCAPCSVCATCLGDDSSNDLRQCDACGLSCHEQCSRQKTSKGDRWLCDACVLCKECGFVMAEENASSPDWETRVSWVFDSAVCGHCAAQIERARVCPECISTYADAESALTMVCCDVCAMWVHSACDPLLTPSVYRVLISRQDAAYVCPACIRPSFTFDPLHCLPRCLRAIEARMDTASSSDCQSSPVSVAVVETTEEAANLLLSLTQSDIRFDHERFAKDYLQARFCSHSLNVDYRCCALCGLSGDGLSGLAQQQQQLGRLVPFGSQSSDIPAPLWAHVECLAWAWGPRSMNDDTTTHGGGGCQVVRFEGTLMDYQETSSPTFSVLLCALCTRPGPTIHCCAPVPCADIAYHLPCLLMAATTLHSEIQYSAAWRRALCPAHAPKYSAMMPVDDPAAGQSPHQRSGLADICVLSRVRFLPPPPPLPLADCFTRIGNLLVLAWGSSATTGPVLFSEGFSAVRYFSLAHTPFTLGLQTFVPLPSSSLQESS
ncbi:hypothetical protein GGI21_000133, partial [Coemansia aciculifera]